jgi:hypothetical protein
MPLQRTQAHEKLASLVGRWTGISEVFPNPWGPSGPAEGEWIFHLDLGGFNLIHDYREQRENGYRFEAHGVLTVDPDSQMVVWFWFDNYGFPPLSPARGQWTDSTLTLQKSTARGDARSVFILGDERLTYEVSSRVTGASDFSPVMKGMFHRKG